MRIPFLWFAVLAGLVCARTAGAGGGPENLVLVVNAANASSLAIANEYIRLRGIPPSHVIYLAGIPAGEVIKVEEFRERVLKPVLETLARRGLTDQIDYLVYSSGFPYGVDATADLGGRKLPHVITQPSALTGLTYLYQLVLEKNTEYLALNPNAYMRVAQLPGGSSHWTPAEWKRYEEAGQLLERYHRAMKKKEPGKKDAKAETAKEEKSATPAEDPAALLNQAERVLAELAAAHPKSFEFLYDHACVLALQGKPDEALSALERAVEAGWWNRRHAQQDSDLASLRGRAEFKGLLERIKPLHFDVQRTHAFRNSYGWSPQGEPVAPDKGRRYLLSTMLAYTGGPANTLAEALASLRRSAAADGTRPEGTIYYVANGDVRSTTREWAFVAAAEALNKLGVKAEIVEGVLPKGKSDVAGAMVGAASFKWKDSGSTILPGAICEHLTSCGGIMKGGGQTLLSEFVRYGAAGASGTVTEPFAIQAKFPMAFLHVHYARGCSLAEAFYQSVAGPYQLLLVGDPLCQPWARIPTVEVEGVKPGEVLKGRRQVSARGRVEPPDQIAHVEFLVDGVRAKQSGKGDVLDLDSTTLADGYHELRAVAICTEMETQGRAVIPFVVSNRGLAVRLDVTPEGKLPSDKPVRVKASLPGAARMTLLQNGRELREAAGSAGEFELQAKELGEGPVRLQVVGTLKDGADIRVVSSPIEFSLVAP